MRQRVLDEVEFEVVAGMCTLKFEQPMRTGRDVGTNPGLGFMLSSEHPAHKAPSDGKFYHGMGVIAREDALRLRDLIDRLLADHPIE